MVNGESLGSWGPGGVRFRPKNVCSCKYCASLVEGAKKVCSTDLGEAGRKRDAKGRKKERRSKIFTGETLINNFQVLFCLACEG